MERQARIKPSTDQYCNFLKPASHVDVCFTILIEILTDFGVSLLINNKQYYYTLNDGMKYFCLFHFKLNMVKT